MKTARHLLSICLLPLAFLASQPVARAQETHPMQRPEFLEKMKHWQSRMSDDFRDQWKKLRESTSSRGSVTSASVDLREQNDTYTVRISLPQRDLNKVEITLEDGKNLRIIAPAEGSLARYEQLISLAAVAPDAKLDIEKAPKGHMIVVHVPKIPGTAKIEPAPAPESAAKPPQDATDTDVLREMGDMRRKMDDIFNKAFDEFRSIPEYHDLFDLPHFGSSFELQEKDGNYVIHVYLPDRNMDDAKVTVDGRILKIEADAKSDEKVNGSDLKRESHYSQMLTLPGPVNGDQLKVDRHEGTLTITVPKKTAG